MHRAPKTEKEGPNDYEHRTWREKCHTAPDGRIFIPPMAFKNCLDEAAKFLGIQIPGKGKATYTKHFEAGVLVSEGLMLEVKKDAVEGEWLLMNSDGRHGSGKRVERCFPKIEQWTGPVMFYIADETITEDVFRYHLEQAGKFIGIGRFRPRNRGYYGRFSVESIEWE
jgi:hypothetical protein